MNDTPTPPAAPAVTTPAQFVAWLRDVAPYVHAHRGKTFVIGVVGELIESGGLNAFVHDASLLHAMGIRLVIVHGSRPQMQAQLALKGLSTRFEQGVRITDAEALGCAKEAAGEIRLDIEAAFSQGLPSTPMGNARIRVVSGNFVTARPLGILDGVDFQLTGVVRKVDAEAIGAILAGHAIVLVSPLGFSPTGEAFNLTLEDTACSIATALRAEKLVLVADGNGIRDRDGHLFPELALAPAEALLAGGTLDAESAYNLEVARKACRGGVRRAHVLPCTLDGGLLLELFTHDGVGTMLTTDEVESMREATIDDVGALLKLLEPLEGDGTLVKRPRELIEREVQQFTVLEHDGVLYGCAALYPFADQAMGEMAAVCVHPDYRNFGGGERLIRRIEARARAAGLQRLFVLTTRTAHWFLKRGFALGTVDDLPIARQRLYNWQRRSQVLTRTL